MVWSWAAWGSGRQLATPHPLTGWVSTAVKSVRGEYYLNGHWTIEASQALPVASTVLQYERGMEGDLAPEQLHARGPTSEPLVIEVSGPRRAGGGGVPLYMWAAQAIMSQAWGLKPRLSAAHQPGAQPRCALRVLPAIE